MQSKKIFFRENINFDMTVCMLLNGMQNNFSSTNDFFSQHF